MDVNIRQYEINKSWRNETGRDRVIPKMILSEYLNESETHSFKNEK